MQQPFIESGKQPEVTILLDDSNDRALKKFHCTICGKVTFEYYSSIRVILPGIGNPVKAPVVIQCHGVVESYKNGRLMTTRGCKAKYYIG